MDFDVDIELFSNGVYAARFLEMHARCLAKARALSRAIDRATMCIPDETGI